MSNYTGDFESGVELGPDTYPGTDPTVIDEWFGDHGQISIECFSLPTWVKATLGTTDVAEFACTKCKTSVQFNKTEGLEYTKLCDHISIGYYPKSLQAPAQQQESEVK
jgi:hypothetical protein